MIEEVNHNHINIINAFLCHSYPCMDIFLSVNHLMEDFRYGMQLALKFEGLQAQALLSMQKINFQLPNFQDGICDKNSAPSVSSISRVLRGNYGNDLTDGSHVHPPLEFSSEDGRTNHSIDGILGKQLA